MDVPLHEVRVFHNAVSRSLTSAQRADAVTVENQVHMAPAHGNASTPSGEALLAHELSHYAARQADASSPNVSQEREEARAQVIEHAVQRQTDSPFPPQIRQPRETPLEHRQTPRVSAAPVQSPFDAPHAPSVGSRGPISSPGGGSSSAMVLARAPVNRIPAAADGGATAMSSLSATASNAPAPGVQRREQDEASMVARVVEAVVRRLRREGALERERRGAFRSEIGG